jgi:hypothetical protein
MTQPELEAWLRTPRGVLALLGGSLVASMILALLLGTQREFFERHVREKYPPVSAEAHEIGRRLAELDAQERVRSLSPREQESLYAAWIQKGHEWPAEAPAVLVRADALFLERAERTLRVGSREQRRAAVRFLAASRDARARPLLDAARHRAQRRREHELVREIQDAIDSLGRGSSRVFAHGPVAMTSMMRRRDE